MFEKEFDMSLLIVLHLRGEITEQEQIILSEWLNANEANRAHFNTLVDEQSISSKLLQFNSPDKNAIWSKTLKGLAEGVGKDDMHNVYFEPISANKLYPWKKYLAIAAVVAFISTVAVLMFNQYGGSMVNEYNTLNSEVIVPGGNKAYLTLADGRTISLTDANNGELAEQAGISIRKTRDGQIIYEVEKDKDAVPKMNIVSTPKGGQYQVVLPDGTKVWLNAASTIHFPSVFVGQKSRLVELKGEAYFEVAKDKARPFIVKSNGQEVEVLGTHFNINAYSDEGSTKTTLLEGLVKVKGAEKDLKDDGKVLKDVLLKPNQQSIFEGNKFTVINVDTETAVDWKNGYFSFNKESLPAIMRKISRWYDVEIIYQDNYTGYDFTGFVSRKKEVSEVLNLLELTGLVHFKIEGRRITVMP
jgi:transmembrane sensor